jgi:hypothetical protein
MKTKHNFIYLLLMLSFLSLGFSQDDFDQAALENETKIESEVNHREFRQFLREHYPSYVKKLKYAQKHNNRAFRRMYRKALQRYMQILRLRKLNKNDYEKAIDILKEEEKLENLISEYKGLRKSEEKEKIKVRIEENLEKIFNLKEEIYKNEVFRIEEKLEKAKNRILKREQNKEKIIKSRLNKILQESDSDLEW